ncbi:MAG: 3-deoxy-7-phosphoheptulonate synthase [Planctomycetes bacterium]|nr:3-deoxy-7-phosphoheptulonate synthase [Planctomycetota bacterium]MCL4730978.1 3-deoxy-7-phosphoheptulonate synthase [Planctomycetota bacterium]
MLILLKSGASAVQIEAISARAKELSLIPQPVRSGSLELLSLTGATAAVDPAAFASMPGVARVMNLSAPFRLASREFRREDTTVDVAGVRIGPGTFTVMAGPCSIESPAQAADAANAVKAAGAPVLRGGLYKPRTSPYSFQGLGAEGFALMDTLRAQTGLRFVTEAIDEQSLEQVEAHADMIQIGARNMQNFSLLRRAGRSKLPVLLKRGMSATLEEWLNAADYVLSGGNPNVVLCERGIRTFNTHARNTLDLGVIPAARELTHLPILVDPSHGTGRATHVPAMACAALAAGADGLLVEVHPDPGHALSDGDQSLTPERFNALMKLLRQLAPAFGRAL